jgi:hypothetical protein
MATSLTNVSLVLLYNNIHSMMFIYSVYQLIFHINENGVTNIFTFILEMPSAFDWQWMVNMSQLNVYNKTIITFIRGEHQVVNPREVVFLRPKSFGLTTFNGQLLWRQQLYISSMNEMSVLTSLEYLSSCFVREPMSYLRTIFVFACEYCVVFLFVPVSLVYPVWPVSMDCQFLYCPFGFH